MLYCGMVKLRSDNSTRHIKVGSDFSGVGAFDQALRRLRIDYETVFSCDMDKYARQSYIANYGEPKYYPENVYDRAIPKESLDVYMTSPPCQAFSLAGNRKGETDKRGILFYNSHEFIIKNKPRFFIFENVKGLLSDNNGKTFANWVAMLGGKSINGNSNIFPIDGSAPYHIYHKVLNAKHYGVPQNRERVFIIGIRDDVDNKFNWPKKMHLDKRLKDVLENEVDEKYYLSDTMVNGFVTRKSNGFRERFQPNHGENHGNCITTRAGSRITDNFIYDAQNQTAIGAMRGRNPDNPNDRSTGAKCEQRLEINSNGTSNTLTSVQKDNLVVQKHNIRRLTPRECFRLMDFPDSFKFVCSDAQLYKQAGNTIVVAVLAKIIEKLNL